MIQLRPVSVPNATVAIVPRRETFGLSPACWAYASPTLHVWTAKSMILQVNAINPLDFVVESFFLSLDLRVSLCHVVSCLLCCCVSEWAGCQRIGISPDTHRVPYHISFGSKNNSSATRHRY